MEEYWFITYSWVGNDGHRVLAHDMWTGRMVNWVLHSLEQPEDWVLLNQVPLNEAEYISHRHMV